MDKGTENVGVAEVQLAKMGTGRGSVLTGRSVQNMRAEYIWPFYKRQVSGPYRKHFFAMTSDSILDVASPVDLHCLHVVYLPILRHATGVFVNMWNNHRIAGPRTTKGRGGGVPTELYCDPVDAVRRIRHPLPRFCARHPPCLPPSLQSPRRASLPRLIPERATR